MKRIRKLISFMLALALILTAIPFMSTPASAASTSTVRITTSGQTVDTFNGVPAKYIPGSGNSDTGTYSCAGYVKAYYSAIFGVSVSNLLSDCTPKADGCSFQSISSGFCPGDIVRLPHHWAIIKEVNGNTLTLIEQNWKWVDGGNTYTKINRTVTYGSTSGLVVFRLYKNGQSMNSGTGNNASSSASEIEDLLFDSTFYAYTYIDLRNAFGFDSGALKNHWKTYGINEGRVASPFFDAGWYLENNPDVAAVYGSNNCAGAYSHFVTYGFNEGRQGSPYFSATYYLNKYSDLKAAFGSDYLAAARHFLTYGLSEGRQASAQFNISVYNENNPDVVRAYPDPLYRISHYICYVQYGSEDRKCV